MSLVKVLFGISVAKDGPVCLVNELTQLGGIVCRVVLLLEAAEEVGLICIAVLSRLDAHLDARDLLGLGTNLPEKCIYLESGLTVTIVSAVKKLNLDIV